MQHTTTQDTLVGLFVASGIAGLFFLALHVSNLSSFSDQDGYVITARFENSGGLKVKSSRIILAPKFHWKIFRCRSYCR